MQKKAAPYPKKSNDYNGSNITTGNQETGAMQYNAGPVTSNNAMEAVTGVIKRLLHITPDPRIKHARHLGKVTSSENISDYLLKHDN